jgi:hypothetical protein
MYLQSAAVQLLHLVADLCRTPSIGEPVADLLLEMKPDTKALLHLSATPVLTSVSEACVPA